jgi:cobalt-zinc-cadmium efflux system outer membrane protein
MKLQISHVTTPNWHRLILVAVWIVMLPASIGAQQPATRSKPQAPRNSQRVARADFQAPPPADSEGRGDAMLKQRTSPTVGRADPPAGSQRAKEQPGKFTLRELSNLALQANPILERSLSEIEAAKGQRIQAGLYPNPTFDTNTPELFGGQNSAVNVAFLQEINVKGKLRLEKAAADQAVRSQTANLQVDRAQLLTAVRKEYYETVAAKQRLLLSQYIIQVARRSLNVAKQLQEAGEGTLTDVLLLDSELQRAYLARDNAKSLLAGEYKQLAAIVGVPEMEIQDVAGTLFDPPPEFDEDQIRGFLSNDSSQMEGKRAELTRNQVLLRRAEVEAYPNLTVGPVYQTGTVAGLSFFGLTVTSEIPVFNLNQGNIRTAQANVRNATADIAVLRNELLRQTAEVYARHQAARQVAERIRTAILPNTQRTLELVQNGFAKGQFDVNRLLQAQRNLSDVAKEHIEAAEQAWTSAAELSGLMQLEEFGD